VKSEFCEVSGFRVEQYDLAPEWSFLMFWAGRKPIKNKQKKEKKDDLKGRKRHFFVQNHG
jgi:hypothetical protein